MDYIHVDELLGPFGLGNTEPCLALSNGTQIVVKFFNNREGNKSLVNELVCYFIAKELELNIPTSGLCLIDDDTKINQNVLDLTEFDPSTCFGIGFYSTLVPNVTKINSAAMIKLSSNYKSLLPRLVLFDHLIFNKDRNPGNLLIGMSKSDKNLYVIDHTHTFNLECIWTSYSLLQKINTDAESTEILDCNQYLYKFFYELINFDMATMQNEVDFFKNKLTKSFFNDIMNKIPIEWGSNEDELLALVEYLSYRFDNLSKFAFMISSFKY